jgi:hypothetical protein
MLNTRSPGVQATRMLQEQNRKELRSTVMMCNEAPTGYRPAYMPSPPRSNASMAASAVLATMPQSPTVLRTDVLRSLRQSPLSSSVESPVSPSVSRFPPLPASPSRPSTVVSPTRRTYHMSMNERRRFYDSFVDRPSNTKATLRPWQQ